MSICVFRVTDNESAIKLPKNKMANSKWRIDHSTNLLISTKFDLQVFFGSLTMNPESDYDKKDGGFKMVNEFWK